MSSKAPVRVGVTAGQSAKGSMSGLTLTLFERIDDGVRGLFGCSTGRCMDADFNPEAADGIHQQQRDLPIKIVCDFADRALEFANLRDFGNCQLWPPVGRRTHARLAGLARINANIPLRQLTRKVSCWPPTPAPSTQ